MSEQPDWYGGELKTWRDNNKIPMVNPDFESTQAEELSYGGRSMYVWVQEDYTTELDEWLHDNHYSDWLDVKHVDIGKRVRIKWSCYYDQAPGDGSCIEYIVDTPFKKYGERCDAGVTDENYPWRVRQLWLMNATATVTCYLLAPFTKRLYGLFRDNVKYVWRKMVKERMLCSEGVQRRIKEECGTNKLKAYAMIADTLHTYFWRQPWGFATRCWRDKTYTTKSPFWQRLSEVLSKWYYTGWTAFEEAEYHAACELAEQEVNKINSDDVDLHHYHTTHNQQYPCCCDGCIDLDSWLDGMVGASDFYNWEWSVQCAEEGDE